jgi:integrase
MVNFGVSRSMNQEVSLAVIPAARKPKLTNVARRSASYEAGKPVAHWAVPEVQALVKAARERGRGAKGERDALLIQTLFDGALRVSEALGLRPIDIVRTDGGYRLQVEGKTGYRQVAVSPSLIARLHSYAYEQGLARDRRFFPINRHRAWQIVDAAAELAGLLKPPGVGTVHILRHSGAIERMRASGNPRSVQDQLGHASPAMTLRYWRTLSQQEALRIQEAIEFGWT